MKIKVNGVILNYEVIGHGKPLLFLHGNNEDLYTFDSLTESLKEHYACYLVDSRNQGKSEKNVPLHYEDMSVDIYEFVLKLKIKNLNIFGFSDGAIIGMILASKHPEIVNKLVLAGGSLNPEGIKKKHVKMMENEYKETKDPFIELMLTEPHITDHELHKITCPTLILAGEHDVIKEIHTKKIHQNISGSKLIIIQEHTHESYIMHSNYLKEIIRNFI